MKTHQTTKDSTEKHREEKEFREELLKRVRKAHLEAEEYLKRHPLPKEMQKIRDSR